MVRTPSQNTGNFRITFNQAHPAGSEYVVNITNQEIGDAVLWNNLPPTDTRFHVIIYSASNGLNNSIFHFSVLA